MTDFLTALALVFVIEGLLLTLLPHRLRYRDLGCSEPGPVVAAAPGDQYGKDDEQH